MARHAKAAEDDPLPSESYLRLLKEYCERLGIRPDDVGVSEMTHSRLFNLGQPTLAAANRYARAVRERGISMPPAHVSILDEIDHEWIVRGRELREVNPDRFNELVAILQQFADAARSQIEATSKLKKLVGDGTTKNVIVRGGDGETS